MKRTVSITESGKAELQKELEALIAERPVLAERIATAREFGDLKENEEYSAARAEQRQAENRILEIEEILKNAKIIQGENFDKVVIGSTILIDLSGKEYQYTLVGPVEADPLNGKISDQSPIGKALLGKKVGDDFIMPNNNKGKILKIS